MADGSPVDYDWWEAVFDQEKYEAMTGRTDQRLDFRATHRVPIAAPVTINRIPLLGQVRMNLSPNINYTEDWFLETERQTADSLGSIQRESVSGFFALRQFSMGVSANTTVYGLFPVRLGEYQGLRHTLRPRLGFSWRPDFSSPNWGYARPLLDEDGMPVEQELVSGEFEERRYPIVPGLQTGQSRSLSFGIDNTFETKRVRVDSTGNEDSRVMKLFNVNVSSNYNMAADSLKLAPIRISARTNVLGKLRLNISGTLSPYRLNSAGTRTVNRYLLNFRDFKFARLTQLSISGNFQLRGELRQAPTNEAAEQLGQMEMPMFDAPTSVGVGNPFGGGMMGMGSPGGRGCDAGLDAGREFQLPYQPSVPEAYSECHGECTLWFSAYPYLACPGPDGF